MRGTENARTRQILPPLSRRAHMVSPLRALRGCGLLSAALGASLTTATSGEFLDDHQFLDHLDHDGLSSHIALVATKILEDFRLPEGFTKFGYDRHYAAARFTLGPDGLRKARSAVKSPEMKS